MLFSGNVLNSVSCSQNVWHLPLVPLSMSGWMGYVKCVCNFKLQFRPGSFWSHSVIVPSLVHSLQIEVRIHQATHISTCRLRSTFITPSSPLSLLIFYLHLTHILVSPATTVHFPPFYHSPSSFPLTGSLCLAFPECLIL